MGLLEVAARGELRLREAQLAYNGGPPTRVLYASDLHLTRWSGRVAGQLVAAAERARPDIVLLGGDLADLGSGLGLLAGCVAALRRICPLLAVSGNHDHYLGVDRVRAAVESGGGLWIEQQPFTLPHGDGAIQIDGSPRAQAAAGFRVLCAHDPAIFQAAAAAGYRLVLAGHLHGGQVVLKEFRQRLYPGAFFYPWNGQQFRQNGTLMLVSRGLNDTLPIRWNCPREVLLCTIR